MVQKVYAFSHRLQIREHSSSGGAYWAVCQAVDSLSGETAAVYGAAWTEDLKVEHRRAAAEEDRLAFCGSKYIRSQFAGICPQIEADLRAGRSVLFTGTPCQAAAVRAYCARRHVPDETLYIADLVCHGVSRPEIWEAFKAWLEGREGSRLTGFQFRRHINRWETYASSARFEGGTERVNTFEVRQYRALLEAGLIMEEACYRCRYASLERPSDLTLGDFWGIHRVMPAFPDEGGVSQILVSTGKGARVLDQIRAMAAADPKIRLEECRCGQYRDYQRNLNAPTARPDRTDRFLSDLGEMEFGRLLKRYAGYGIRGRIAFEARKFLKERGIAGRIKRLLSKPGQPAS